jgi:hypothetical protein
MPKAAPTEAAPLSLTWEKPGPLDRVEKIADGTPKPRSVLKIENPGQRIDEHA